MALSDVKVRSAKPEAKAYKLTDGEGMVLLVHQRFQILAASLSLWRQREDAGAGKIP